MKHMITIGNISIICKLQNNKTILPVENYRYLCQKFTNMASIDKSNTKTHNYINNFPNLL